MRDVDRVVHVVPSQSVLAWQFPLPVLHRSIMTQPACPPDHLAYSSEMLASNAVVLHGLAMGCAKYHHWPCRLGEGEPHFHVGHTSKSAGTACKEKFTDQKRFWKRGSGLAGNTERTQ